MDRKLMVFLGLLIIGSLVLAACGGVAPTANGDEGVSDTDGQGNGENADGGAGDSVNPNDGDNEDCPDCNNDAGAGGEDADSGGENEADSSEDFVPEPAAPQPFTFFTLDEREIEGTYYPPGVPDAPVVILMHWAPGDMTDWNVVAPWLQNRPGEVDLSTLTGYFPYEDPRWFPPMPEEVSFGVIRFNFGGYGASQPGSSRASMVDDGLGALRAATKIEGLDANRLLLIGASIGADGVVDSCYLFNLNEDVDARCIGALSLSPGNYLTDEFTYNEAAAALDADGVPVWCLAAQGDGDSPALCGKVGGAHGRGFLLEGGDHGMNLLTMDQVFVDPLLGDEFNTMIVIQEFLETTTMVTMNSISLP